jgi:hypothetical protein
MVNFLLGVSLRLEKLKPNDLESLERSSPSEKEI